MLIDLGDAGRGNPVIDLIHCYFVLYLIGNIIRKMPDDEISFNGITYRDMREFWKIFIDTYCDGNKEKVAELEEKLKPYSTLMYMTVSLSHPLMPKEYRKIYVDMVRSEVLPRYDEIMKFSWEI